MRQSKGNIGINWSFRFWANREKLELYVAFPYNYTIFEYFSKK